jgi:hypothetical protein
MQGPLNNNSLNEYDFSALDGLQPKEFKLGDVLKEMLFFSLPLFSFLFFLGILVYAVIPNINDMNSRLAEVDKIRSDEAALKVRITKIRELQANIASIQQTIDKINAIVPTGRTEVVKFGDRIMLNIDNNTLKSDGYHVGESELVTNQTPAVNATSGTSATATTTQTGSTGDPTYLPLYQLPATFNVTGKFNDIRNFFKQMYNGQDFFVVDKMDLTGSGGPQGGDWTGDISLVKYQFTPNPAFDPVKAYMNISEATPLNPTVMNFLQTKYVNNVFDQPNVSATPTPAP